MVSFNALILGLLVIFAGSVWFLHSGKESESPEKKAARDMKAMQEKLDAINEKLDALLMAQAAKTHDAKGC